MNYDKKALQLHKKNNGKIEISSKIPLKTKTDLSAAYTPGVAAVSTAIGADVNKSWSLTNRANQVAIVSDGTAILGLGDLGPEAAMPVMEGKSVIFKKFAGIDAVPLCINTTDVDEIVRFCEIIAPSFAGINLEDISAPRCFDIVSRLEKLLSIPVFHDDQDGTAVATLAALINAARVLQRDLRAQRVVINGAGAAGIAIARLLHTYGVKDMLVLDSKGIISTRRSDLNTYKKKILNLTNVHHRQGSLKDAMVGADIFIGVSVGNVVTKKMITSMNPDPIILAMANPTPEILPQQAYTAGAALVGTGRSDFPNQVNNALVFPGVFKGLLQYQVKKIQERHLLQAAHALANTITPTKNAFVPKITHKDVVENIAYVFKAL